MTTDARDAGAATPPEDIAPKKRRRWPRITVALVVVAAFGVLGYLVYDLNGQVDDLSTRIARVSGQTANDLSWLESDVSSLESDVSSLESDVSSLESDVSQIESNMEQDAVIYIQLWEDLTDCVNDFIRAWSSGGSTYLC